MPRAPPAGGERRLQALPKALEISRPTSCFDGLRRDASATLDTTRAKRRASPPALTLPRPENVAYGRVSCYFLNSGWQIFWFAGRLPPALPIVPRATPAFESVPGFAHAFLAEPAWARAVGPGFGREADFPVRGPLRWPRYKDRIMVSCQFAPPPPPPRRAKIRAMRTSSWI